MQCLVLPNSFRKKIYWRSSSQSRRSPILPKDWFSNQRAGPIERTFPTMDEKHIFAESCDKWQAVLYSTAWTAVTLQLMSHCTCLLVPCERRTWLPGHIFGLNRTSKPCRTYAAIHALPSPDWHCHLQRHHGCIIESDASQLMSRQLGKSRLRESKVAKVISYEPWLPLLKTPCIMKPAFC